MREVSDWYCKDGCDERHGQEDDSHKCEYHYGLPLTAGKSGLISCEAGFEGIGMLLFEVEKMRQLHSVVSRGKQSK